MTEKRVIEELTPKICTHLHPCIGTAVHGGPGAEDGRGSEAHGHGHTDQAGLYKALPNHQQLSTSGNFCANFCGIDMMCSFE